MVDVTLIFFNFYSDCQFELALINVGNLTSKISSAFNFSNSVVYMMINWYSTDSSPIRNLLMFFTCQDDTNDVKGDDASCYRTNLNDNFDAYNYEDKQLLGEYYGAVIKQLFSF